MDMDNEYPFILLGELALENLFVTCNIKIINRRDITVDSDLLFFARS